MLYFLYLLVAYIDKSIITQAKKKIFVLVPRILELFLGNLCRLNPKMPSILTMSSSFHSIEHLYWR